MIREMNFIIIFIFFLMFDAYQSSYVYKESKNDMLSQCNTLQQQINWKNRTVHLCEKVEADSDYRYYINVMETPYSKQKYLCFLFFKDEGKLNFKLTFSHKDYDVNAYGVKFAKPHRTFWASEIKFKISLMIVVPHEGRPVPEIYGLELNNKDVCPFCGSRPNVQALVASGKEVSPSKWPWHATLFYVMDGSIAYKCGGSIINEITVLTAAHCLVKDGSQVAENILRVKIIHGDNLFGSSEVHNVDKAIVHKDYDFKNLRNDIALLILKTKIILRHTKMRAICLPKANMADNEKFKTGIVVGYGSTEESQSHSEVLREVDMPIVEKEECYDSDKDFFITHLNTGNYCAGQLNVQKGVCSGDSGGGFYVEHEGLYYLKGLVSMTKEKSGEKNPTCNQASYAIFTEVAHYLEWINDNKGGN